MYKKTSKTTTTTTTTMVFLSGVLLLTLSHLYQNTEEETTKCIEEIQNFISKPPRPRKISFT